MIRVRRQIQGPGIGSGHPAFLRMRRLPAVVAALLLPVAPTLLLGTAIGSASLVLFQARAQAQNGEAVAKVARAITVRIEGATQGSGVLVKRDGNRYTVLTAWHVVADQKPGEELEIYTPDGQRHQLEQGSIKRLGAVDLAVLTFTSSKAYELATIGDVKSISSGSSIYVSGFPLPTSAVPTRISRFLKGDVIANATVAIPNGYQLLYSNPTLPGMSGGAVLNAQGQLVGIHASAERADQISESSGKAVATGTNQAVPIVYYSQSAAGAAVLASSSARVATADDYLAQAKALLGKKGSEQQVIRLAGQALTARQSAEAYFYRAYAKDYSGDKRGAIADYGQAIVLNPQYADAYYNRGNVRSGLGDKRGAISDFSQVIAIDPQNAKAYNNRGAAKSSLGDKRGAIADYSQAIAVNPQDAKAYRNRGIAYENTGDLGRACSDWRAAASLGVADAADWVRAQCQ